MNKLVTIIMPTFNREHIISETLRAVENQLYTHFECLIIDDGSTDNTEVAIENLNLDNRFKYYKRPNEYAKGPSGCRNFALDNSLGDYIIFFDDDDIPHPENLQTCLKEIPGYDYCRYRRAVFNGDFHNNFDTTSNYDRFIIKGKGGVLNLLNQNTPFNCCAVFWNRKCFETIRFNEELIYAEERECFHRILVNGAVGISIEKTLIYARKHEESSTGRSHDKTSKQYASIIREVKIVIANIARKNMLDASFTKYFAWESVRYRDKSIYDCLISQKQIGYKNRLIAYWTFYASPLIIFKIKIMKRLKKFR